MRRLTDSTKNGRIGRRQTEGGEMGRLMASPLAFGGSCVRWGRGRVGSVRKGRPSKWCPMREAFGRWTQGTLEDTH